MSTNVRRLGYLGLAGLAIVLVGRAVLTGAPPAAGVGPMDASHPSPTVASAMPTQTDFLETAPTPQDENFRSYAIATTELDGLPPDIAPGSRLDLWVAWDRPVTKSERVQPLIRDVVLDRIIPPVTPDGPLAALLLVKESAVPDLLYGDMWGRLTVTVTP